MPKSTLYVIIAAVIVILVAAAAFFQLGVQQGKKSLEDEIVRAQKIIAAYTPPVPDYITGASGQIKNIKDNVVSLEVNVLGTLTLPGEQPEKEIIKVIVGEETKITKMEFPENPMEMPKQVEISLDDLEVEDWLYVSSGENIKDKKEFTAKTIELRTAMAAPAPAPVPTPAPAPLAPPIPPEEIAPAP